MQQRQSLGNREDGSKMRNNGQEDVGCRERKGKETEVKKLDGHLR